MLWLFLNSQDKFDEAGPLHDRVIAILKEALGATHPDVAEALNFRALVFNSQVWKGGHSSFILRESPESSQCCRSADVKKSNSAGRIVQFAPGSGGEFRWCLTWCRKEHRGKIPFHLKEGLCIFCFKGCISEACEGTAARNSWEYGCGTKYGTC